MIQRIQSIFLFVVGVTMIITLFFPIWQKQNTQSQDTALLNTRYLTQQQKGSEIKKQNTMYLSALAFVAAVVAFASLFSYRNRLRQLQLNLLNTLLIAGYLFTALYLAFQGERLFDVSVKGSFGVGFYAAPAALLCNILANRFIRRDEHLVRDSNRLR